MIAKLQNGKDKRAALGARLAIVRVEAGLTQDSFAKSIGLSPRAYHYYERGQRSMPIEAIDRIGEVYGVDMNWLHVLFCLTTTTRNLLDGGTDIPLSLFPRQLVSSLYRMVYSGSSFGLRPDLEVKKLCFTLVRLIP